MPQNANRAEANELPADIDAALDAALEKSGVNLEQKAIQDAAAAEERRAGELIAQSRANQPQIEEPPQEESLVQVMSRGREHLLQKMREHAERSAAKKEAYKPPPMTDRMRQKIEEEQAAGRRAAERHEAQLASRPPPVKDPADGTTVPVHRPGNTVPDPTVPAPSGFAAGGGQYSPEV